MFACFLPSASSTMDQYAKAEGGCSLYDLAHSAAAVEPDVCNPFVESGSAKPPSSKRPRRQTEQALNMPPPSATILPQHAVIFKLAGSTVAPTIGSAEWRDRVRARDYKQNPTSGEVDDYLKLLHRRLLDRSVADVPSTIRELLFVVEEKHTDFYHATAEKYVLDRKGKWIIYRTANQFALLCDIAGRNIRRKGKQAVRRGSGAGTGYSNVSADLTWTDASSHAVAYMQKPEAKQQVTLPKVAIEGSKDFHSQPPVMPKRVSLGGAAQITRTASTATEWPVHELQRLHNIPLGELVDVLLGKLQLWAQGDEEKKVVSAGFEHFLVQQKMVFYSHTKPEVVPGATPASKALALELQKKIEQQLVKVLLDHWVEIGEKCALLNRVQHSEESVCQTGNHTHETRKSAVELETESAVASLKSIQNAPWFDYDSNAEIDDDNGMLTLRNYSHGSHVQRTIADFASVVDLTGEQASGIKPVIVKAMETHSNSVGVQEQACLALSKLAKNNDNLVSIVEAGGIEAMVKAMNNYPRSAFLQQWACGALALLAEHDENSVIARVNGIKSIVVAMERHRNIVDVQVHATRALEMLTGRKENLVPIVEAGGIAAMVNVMNTHPESIGVQQSACGVLARMALEDDNIKTIASNLFSIAEARGVEAILAAMDGHRNTVDVQAQACRALANLAERDENKTLLAQAEGIESIVTAMGRHRNAVKVQVQACRALAMLVCVGNDSLLLQAGGIEAIVAAMNQHPIEVCVQEPACQALASLAARDNEAHKLSIAAARGIDAILVAMENHLDSADVQESACIALEGLAEKIAIKNLESKTKWVGFYLVRKAAATHFNLPTVVTAADRALKELSLQQKLLHTFHGR